MCQNENALQLSSREQMHQPKSQVNKLNVSQIDADYLEGRLKKRHIEKQKENGKRKNKNYFILKSEKVFYLCTPNRKEGLKKSSGGCRGRPETKRLKRAETGKRRSRLMPN